MKIGDLLFRARRDPSLTIPCMVCGRNLLEVSRDAVRLAKNRRLCRALRKARKRAEKLGIDGVQQTGGKSVLAPDAVGGGV